MVGVHVPSGFGDADGGGTSRRAPEVGGFGGSGPLKVRARLLLRNALLGRATVRGELNMVAHSQADLDEAASLLR